MNTKHLFQLLISLIAYSAQGIAQTPTPPVPLSPPVEEEIFKVVEEMPRFPGCEDKDISLREKSKCAKELMKDYVYDNLVYPDIAMENGVEGMAVVQFIVWKDGTISDVMIKRDPGAGTGKEAVRIIESMNDMDEMWRPGHQRGRAVNVKYTMPIKFNIED